MRKFERPFKGFGEGLFLHGECCFQLDLRGLYRFMTEPQGNDGAVDTRLQQLQRHRVSKQMTVTRFPFNEGTLWRRSQNVF